jgi:hypothetical protein
MKIIAKVLYAMMAFFLVLLIVQSGGANQLKMSSFHQDNVHRYPDDVEYTLGVLSATFRTVYADANINAADVPFFQVRTPDANFDLTFYRFGCTGSGIARQEVDGQTREFDFYRDGYFIHLTNFQSSINVNFVTLTFYTLALDDIVNGSPRELQYHVNIPVGQDSEFGMPRGWGMFSHFDHIIARHFIALHGTNRPTMNNIDWALHQNYNINMMYVTANTDNNRTIPLFFGWEQGSGGDLIPRYNNVPQRVEWDFDFMSMEHMRFSRVFLGSLFGQTLPAAELRTLLQTAVDDNVIIWQIADLSPYWYWTLVIVLVFVIILGVIPYFFMFRKPIKKAFAARKERKRRAQVGEEKLKQTTTNPQAHRKTVQEAQKIKQKREENTNDNEKDQ